VFENFRNRAINARAFFEQEKLPFQQKHFGGTLLGPVGCPRSTRARTAPSSWSRPITPFSAALRKIVVYTTPTLDFLKGNFPRCATNGTARPIYDPSTGVSDGQRRRYPRALRG